MIVVMQRKARLIFEESESAKRKPGFDVTVCGQNINCQPPVHQQHALAPHFPRAYEQRVAGDTAHTRSCLRACHAMQAMSHTWSTNWTNCPPLVFVNEMEVAPRKGLLCA
jgi:hypothetical protein